MSVLCDIKLFTQPFIKYDVGHFSDKNVFLLVIVIDERYQVGNHHQPDALIYSKKLWKFSKDALISPRYFSASCSVADAEKCSDNSI